MRIRDVELLTGLSRKTIRFYEAKGLLCVDRSDNSYREYDESDVERLKRIAVLRQAGVSLADIQLWQDNVISTSEMLNKRLSELRNEADIAMDQVKLCSRLLGGELWDLSEILSGDPAGDAENEEQTAAPITPFIGIDIGTTTISAVVLDVNTGMPAGVYTIANGSDIPTGRVWEKLQDADRIRSRIGRLLDSLLGRYPGVKAIGITGQMHGILYIDGEGRAVSPLYTWQDQRAGLGSPSPCQRMEELTGYRVSPGYGLATHYANTLAGTVPENAVMLCTVMDYLVMELTGRKKPLMHSSNAASLGLYRICDNVFDRDAVLRCGLDPDFLPDVTEKCEIAGYYRGIAVSAAIGDNQASFMGSVKDPEHSVLANFGTGSQISVMSGSPGPAGDDPAMEIRPYLENCWLASGSALCGGRAYALMERFFRSYVKACGMPEREQYEVMNRLAEEGLEKGDFLKVRTSFCGTRGDPGVRGAVDGISEDNLTPEAMIAGTLWGMADELYGMYLQMSHNSADTLIISGNAVRKNPALRRMLSHVFGMEVYLPAHMEEAAFGAAMFAAAASGWGLKELAACITYTKA
ncbi:MAG: MerR family transcriptional regulator [Clostridia bacterium]|nr:MerR family transcriptional regulator [Clostridia bacterium]